MTWQRIIHHGTALILLLPFALSLPAQDSIRKQASWSPAEREEVVAAFETWLRESKIDRQTANVIRQYLDSADSGDSQRLDFVIGGLAIGDADVARFSESLSTALPGKETKPSNLLENEACHSFVSSHVRLLYGRWLARNALYDESLEQLEKLDVESVLDPGTLLYYRGLMEHQLLKPKICIATLNRLLENEEALPRRYVVLAKLMLADMKQLEENSLDEISRMMSDIRRRTELNRSGKRVREQEQDVVKKLDELIKRLEEQQRQMQMAQSQGNTRPSAPADREQRLGGQGSGNVRSKRQTDGGEWGDLNPAQRDAAMAEMSKDLPPHYRSVIEEYFRKLADQTDKQ